MARSRVTAASAALLAGLALTAACGGSSDGGSAARNPAAASPASSDLVLVALGDSDATGAGDPTGAGWVGAYAGLVQAASHRHVQVRTHATEGQTSAGLLSSLGADTDPVVADVRAADVVVIGTGGGDLNDADAAFLSGSCAPARCYGDVLHAYDATIDKVMGRVAALR